MVLEGEWRAKQCEDAVACGLRDVSAVAMRCLDHQPQHRVDKRPRVFLVEMLDKLGRSLDVCEQRGHCLALVVWRLPRFRGYLDAGRHGAGRLSGWRTLGG
jgi:hypothetical protein